MMNEDKHKTQESQMLQAIREGDRRMYRLLFERYYPILCTYGTRFVQLEEAKEIAQDSLLWLWEHREEVTIESSLSGYLLSMVYHRSVNLLLQNQARLKAESRYLQAVKEMLNEENPIQFNELQQRVQTALCLLPDTYREAFMMHRFGNKSYKEIAELLQVSPKTVDYRIQQALKQLRILLKDYSPLLIWLIGETTIPLQ
ncbi:MAG: RNA polymerase sigma-70 factor [Parabacteroides sp.]